MSVEIKMQELFTEIFGNEWKNDPNLKDTPRRMAKSWAEKMSSVKIEDFLSTMKITFPSTYNGMSTLFPIRAYSICPHHFENITYTVGVGYIPVDEVIGLSKVPRIVKFLARQPIIQEDYTVLLANTFERLLGKSVEGVGITVFGKHDCVCVRGVGEPDMIANTNELRGSFRANPVVKMEFFDNMKLIVKMRTAGML